MARFERSGGRDSGSRRRNPRDRRTYEQRIQDRDARMERDRENSGRGGGDRGRRGRNFSRGGRDRDFKRFGNNRRDAEMTKVTCSACKKECEVPFRPTSNKPVYCSDCFKQNDDGGSRNRSSGISEKDLDMINEKLNKIMEALNID